MPDSLVIHLQNQTASSDVFAYITGLALQHNGARVLLQANGRDLYFPQNPPAILQPLAADVAIPLGPPGNTVAVTIPQIAGDRIWFSRGPQKLTFLLNPGGDGSPAGPAALVEPSVLNPTDANAAIDFAFAEFTLNADQLFANISYVDFVSRLPIALTLQTAGDKSVQHVSGLSPDGFDAVCAGLRAQAQKDGRPWDKLIVNVPGTYTPLRILHPTHGEAVGASFAGYFEPHVDEVWKKYSTADITIDTQIDPPGVLRGRVDPATGQLVIDGESFAKPTTADILGCNTGPFVTGPSAKRNAIIPRLAAAFVRSCLLAHPAQPSHADTYYQVDPTNHYGRILHAANLDGKGYAFAYDDVQPNGGADQSGKANAGDPAYFLVAVGGSAAFAGDRLP